MPLTSVAAAVWRCVWPPSLRVVLSLMTELSDNVADYRSLVTTRHIIWTVSVQVLTQRPSHGPNCNRYSHYSVQKSQLSATASCIFRWIRNSTTACRTAKVKHMISSDLQTEKGQHYTCIILLSIRKTTWYIISVVSVCLSLCLSISR